MSKELFVEEGYNGAKYYDKDAVDALLAEKDAEIAELKARIQLDDDEMAGFLDLEEECGGGDLRNYIAELKKKLMPCLNGDCILTCEVVEKYGKENAELKAENERLKATPEEIMKEVFDKMLIYPHDMVRLEDAYRLAVSLRKAKRAFYKACANWAKSERYTEATWHGDEHREELWANVQAKCLAKAEEYK